MTLVETKTLASAQSSIEFVSIPQDADDLLVKFSVRGTNAQTFDQVIMRLNNSTSTYTTKGLFGSGSSIGQEGFSDLAGAKIGVGVGANATANTFCNGEAYITSYKGSNTKTITAMDVAENNATEAYQFMYNTVWSGTAAITSLLFYTQNATNFVSGSTISLYKITKGTDGIVVVS